MGPLEIENAKTLITSMTLNKDMELKDIYGESWSNISTPTTFGKDFKKAYDNGSFPNLTSHGVKQNGPNHEQYEKIK